MPPGTLVPMAVRAAGKDPAAQNGFHARPGGPEPLSTGECRGRGHGSTGSRPGAPRSPGTAFAELPPASPGGIRWPRAPSVPSPCSTSASCARSPSGQVPSVLTSAPGAGPRVARRPRGLRALPPRAADSRGRLRRALAADPARGRATTRRPPSRRDRNRARPRAPCRVRSPAVRRLHLHLPLDRSTRGDRATSRRSVARDPRRFARRANRHGRAATPRPRATTRRAPGTMLRPLATAAGRPRVRVPVCTTPRDDRQMDEATTRAALFPVAAGETARRPVGLAGERSTSPASVCSGPRACPRSTTRPADGSRCPSCRRRARARSCARVR